MTKICKLCGATMVGDICLYCKERFRDIELERKRLKAERSKKNREIWERLMKGQG